MIVPPPKHVHASHNFVELLSLQSQYEDYVRPYFGSASADDGAGAAGEGPNKKRKLDVRKFDKGYQGLLDDCIGMLRHLGTLMLDPVPNLAADMKNGNRELLSLISDIHGPVNPLGRVMPDIWDRPIELLPGQAFAAATLEVGSKVTGVRLKLSILAFARFLFRHHSWSSQHGDRPSWNLPVFSTSPLCLCSLSLSLSLPLVNSEPVRSPFPELRLVALHTLLCSMPQHS